MAEASLEKYKNVRIGTPRLLLRPLTAEDAPDMFAYAQDPDVGPMAGWSPHQSVEESRRLIQVFRETRSGVCLGIEEKESGKIIGTISLAVDAHRPRVPGVVVMGYALSKAHWGRGLMPEAARAMLDFGFCQWKLSAVVITHYPENHRSRRVIEKTGFRFDGIMRAYAVRYNGAVTDLWSYSITAAEYYALRAKEQGYCLRLPEEIDPALRAEYRREWGREPMTPYAMGLQGLSEAAWLDKTIANRTRPAPGRVPSTLYLFVDHTGRPLGALALREHLNGALLLTGGHIGYGLRPTARGRGLAPFLLGLGLEKARELGIQRALVTCDDGNLPSARTIRDCGGVLENLVEDEDGELVRRYWVNL